MILYELIMTSATISDDVKKKLIEQIASNKMSKENIEKVTKILLKDKKKLDKITINYIKKLDKLYAKHIKNDVKRITMKEKKVERNCKELKQKLKEWNPEKLLDNIK